jgi:hypothetical protein
MNSPSFDQYLQLSQEERARQDRLYFEELMNPQHRAFLAGLLKMSIRTPSPRDLCCKGLTGGLQMFRVTRHAR